MPVAVGPRGPARENINSRTSSRSRSTVVNAPDTVAGLPGWMRWRSPGTSGRRRSPRRACGHEPVAPFDEVDQIGAVRPGGGRSRNRPAEEVLGSDGDRRRHPPRQGAALIGQRSADALGRCSRQDRLTCRNRGWKRWAGLRRTGGRQRQEQGGGEERLHRSQCNKSRSPQHQGDDTTMTPRLSSPPARGYRRSHGPRDWDILVPDGPSTGSTRRPMRQPRPSATWDRLGCACSGRRRT